MPSLLPSSRKPALASSLYPPIGTNCFSQLLLRFMENARKVDSLLLNSRAFCTGLVWSGGGCESSQCPSDHGWVLLALLVCDSSRSHSWSGLLQLCMNPTAGVQGLGLLLFLARGSHGTLISMKSAPATPSEQSRRLHCGPRTPGLEE